MTAFFPPSSTSGQMLRFTFCLLLCVFVCLMLIINVLELLLSQFLYDFLLTGLKGSMSIPWIPQVACSDSGRTILSF